MTQLMHKMVPWQLTKVKKCRKCDVFTSHVF